MRPLPDERADLGADPRAALVFCGLGAPAEDPPPRWNIAPTQDAPIVIAAAGGAGEGRMARWDFVPFFHRAPLEAKKWSSFNAKAETVATAPAFRDAFRARRCLVPARGFFEWKRDGKAKQPFVFEPVDGGLLFFAGVWSAWRGMHKGAPVAFTSFAILTTAPNPLVADVHDRMPAILLSEECEVWLFGAPDEALKLLGPYPAQLLRARPVNPALGAVANDYPDLLETA